MTMPQNMKHKKTEEFKNFVNKIVKKQQIENPDSH